MTRFRIKRVRIGLSSDWPWTVTDRCGTDRIGHARSYKAAIDLVDAIINGISTVLDDNEQVIAYATFAPIKPVERREGGPVVDILGDILGGLGFRSRQSDYALFPPADFTDRFTREVDATAKVAGQVFTFHPEPLNPPLVPRAARRLPKCTCSPIFDPRYKFAERHLAGCIYA